MMIDPTDYLVTTTLPQACAPDGRISVYVPIGQVIDAEWVADILQCSKRDAKAALVRGERLGQIRAVGIGKYIVNEGGN